MAEAYTPDGQHDFIPEELRRTQEAINAVVMDAYYGQMCSDLRAEVFSTLATNSALENGQGWAIFDLNACENGSVALADGTTDVLVRAVIDPKAPERTDDWKVPNIHIVTNEQIMGLNGQLSFMTYDFTLDYENDARYLADGIWPDAKKNNPDQMITKYGALFCFDEQHSKLILMNRPTVYFTQAMPVSDGKRTIQPFGIYNCLEDKIQALSFAHGVLSQLAGLEPAYTSAQC